MTNHSTNSKDKKAYFFDENPLPLLLLMTFSLFFSMPSSASLLNPTEQMDNNDKSSWLKPEVPTTDTDSLILQTLGLSESPGANPAIDLARRGINRIQSGDSAGGMADLSKAWEMDPKLSAAGVAITVTYLKLKDYQKAQEITKKLQKLYPDNPAGYTLEGVTYAALKQNDKAKSAFEKAYSRQPGDINSGKNLAEFAILDQQYDKARNLYQQILAQNPDNAGTVVLLAKLELKLKNPQQAKTILEKALSSNPQAAEIREFFVRLHFTAGGYQQVLDLTRALSQKDIHTQPSLLEFRGKTQMLINDAPSAINTFEQLLTVLPDSAPAHYMLARAYFQNQDLQKSLQQINRSIQLQPDYLPARIAEITTLQLSGKTEQAGQRLKVLQQDFKDHMAVTNSAGWLAMQQGRYPEATKHFRVLAQQAPSSDSTNWLYMSLLKQKHYDEGIQVLQSWLKQHPNDTVLLSLLADSYVGLNRIDDAIAAYSRLIELAPDQAQAYNNLAYLLREQDIQKAINLAEKAHELDPNNAHIKDTLGTLLITGAQLKKGSSMLKEAAQLAPEDLQIQYHYAQALLKQDHASDARAILRAIINKSPESPAGVAAKKMLSAMK